MFSPLLITCIRYQIYFQKTAIMSKELKILGKVAGGCMLYTKQQ
jgi:hypothetical protein